LLDSATIFYLLLAAAVAGVWGWVMGHSSGSRAREREIELAQAQVGRERSEADRVIARLKQQLDESEGQAKHQGEVFHVMPDLVRQMFATPDLRGLGDRALKLVDKLLQPEQSAAFLVRRSQRVLDLDFATGGSRLVPTASRGWPLPPQDQCEIELGQGRVGYAAKHGAAMDGADFARLGGHIERVLEADPAGLRVDAVAAIENGQTLFGVLCVGRARSRQGQEKRLLKMVADLTAMAADYITDLRLKKDAAETDGLTGVYNKRYLTQWLGDEIVRAGREGFPISLLILDLDHFKHYNDRNGHLAGDEVLKRVGELLKRSGRDDDVAVRYGGEEFVVVYPGATKAQALRLAETLRKDVEEYPFPHAASQPLGKVTISGGVASFPEDSRDSIDLIRSADQALYEAKAAGRNRVLAARPTYLS
jgi:diguanylate cyclase (GGDEF)-like protein